MVIDLTGTWKANADRIQGVKDAKAAAPMAAPSVVTPKPVAAPVVPAPVQTED